MFKNYIKVGFRTVWRNKLYAFINIFGLSVALACAIVAYLNYQFATSFDVFHKHADEIYRVESIRKINDKDVRYGIVPLPLGPSLVQDLSGVSRAVRLATNNSVVRYGDKIFNESITYVDEEFLEMFSFPLKTGSSEFLKHYNEIAVTEEWASKYFGAADPIGKVVSLKYPTGIEQSLTVAAVFSALPKNSSLQFDVLASIKLLEDAKIDQPNNWSQWATALFAQIPDAAQFSFIEQKLSTYIALQNSANQKMPISGLYFEPLHEMAENARSVRSNGLMFTSPPSAIIGPSVVAVLLLLIACFNYINTSVAFSSQRLKEIGIRKVVGSLRSQLIMQFMTENFLMVALAFIAALGLAEIFVPTFASMMPYVPITLDFGQNTDMLIFMVILLIVTALLAGLYPAYFISSFTPSAILKGTQKIGRVSLLMRTLLTLQFAFSMMTMIASFVFARNAEFQKNIDMGFEKDLIVNIQVSNESEFTLLKNAIEPYPGIVSVSGSKNQIFFAYSRQVAKAGTREFETEVLSVGFRYIETMALRLKAGRSFDEAMHADAGQSAIVNEKLVAEMGWRDPLDHIVIVDSVPYRIVGVVEDFYNGGVWRPVSPSLIKTCQPQEISWMQVRIKPEGIKETSDFLRTTWQKLIPNAPYEGFFQDRIVALAVNISENIKTMFYYIGFMSVAIAAMGLFALVSLNIARRTKEIGIRKVLGASVTQIMGLINREFIILLLLASLIADVGGYVLVKLLLDSIYAYNAGVGLIALAAANLLVLLVAITTGGSRVWKAATANPVEALKYE